MTKNTTPIAAKPVVKIITLSIDNLVVLPTFMKRPAEVEEMKFSTMIVDNNA